MRVFEEYGEVSNVNEIIERLEKLAKHAVHEAGEPQFIMNLDDGIALREAIALLKEQEQRHRLEVHNIGNVDVPEGVTWEQFQAVMSGVVKALEHTDRGESWPYDKGEGRSNDA